MAEIIAVDESGGRPDALTQTGGGGFISAGYLRDRPAESYLEPGERPLFVLTNGRRGVELGDRQFQPGSDYRTVVVLTDRRVLVVVGNAGDGDWATAVPLLDVEAVTANRGRTGSTLEVARADGPDLVVHTARSGLDEAADFLRQASQAWIHVENRLDAIERTLDRAANRRDAGAYDDALAAVETAMADLSDPRDTAARFRDRWGSAVLTAMIDDVADRCEQALADVRRSRAGRIVQRALAHWHAGEYERARETLREAITEYEASRVDERLQTRVGVASGRSRTYRLLDALADAPLGRARSTDESAAAIEDPTAKAVALERTLSQYRTALELDWGAEDPDFSGDADAIRERLVDVVARLVAARRDAARVAIQAGNWHAMAGDDDSARAAYREARGHYRRGLVVARELLPAAVEELQGDLDALEERAGRLDGSRDGGEASASGHAT